MVKEKKILALIPARSGSKGLPRKNVKRLAGKPLIAWSIEQAKESKYIDTVIVSTDDKEIADISRRYKADTPFLRPKKLAKDNSKGIDVVLHAIEWVEKSGHYYDLIMLLQPTSPLRTGQDIDLAIELLFNKNAQAIVSVCNVEHNPFWSNILPEDGCMKDFIKTDVAVKNRQELPLFYRLNGAIYLAYSDYIKACRGFFGKKTYAYKMPMERSVDIDSEIDFKFAEFLMKKGKR